MVVFATTKNEEANMKPLGLPQHFFIITLWEPGVAIEPAF